MIEIRPIQNCKATVAIPGSKSYTHRALIVSALAEGESVLTNALRSEDTDYTAQALEKFGAKVFWQKNSFTVLGTGGKLKPGEEKIYVGNSGTSLRFLTALAALKNGRTVLDGSERMRQRPIAQLLEGLNAFGVDAYSQDGNGYPPVVVDSRGLRGGVAQIRGDESSQYFSALLLVAPLAKTDGRIEIIGRLSSKPYIDITLDVMSAFGAEVRWEDDRAFIVRAGQQYLPRKYPIEGDASNASYFLAAAAVTGGEVRVENFNPRSIQGDRGFLEILEAMGCGVIRGENFAEVRGRGLRGIEIDMNPMPDLVPTLAVTAAFTPGITVMKNIGHLRLKESDRITAVAGELRKMGVQVEEGKDWLKVRGGTPRGAEIETYNDHRIAMSFAIAGLVIPGVKIKEERCVEKSFPDFWERFGMLCESETPEVNSQKARN